MWLRISFIGSLWLCMCGFWVRLLRKLMMVLIFSVEGNIGIIMVLVVFRKWGILLVSVLVGVLMMMVLVLLGSFCVYCFF